MKKEENGKIDFVITWVDGNDENWLKEKEQYVPSGSGFKDTNTKNRYRDMGLLKYWFRSVEKYAPWVNKIYFITWGHVPQWLNINNEKLVIVNHKDFIPSEVLPTFNSNTIEFYINKIEGLSEHFVYFNDDMFVNKPISSSYFFKNGKPRDSLIFNCFGLRKNNGVISNICFNNLMLIAQKFNKKQVVKENFGKIYNLKYGKGLLRTLLLSPWQGFTGIDNPHMPIAYNKSNYEKVWEHFEKEINQTTHRKVRSTQDVSHWLIRYWQLLSGDFEPKRLSGDKYFSTYDDCEKICKAIEKKQYKLICINDADVDGNFEEFTQRIINAYEKTLPVKSSFEK